MNDLLKQVLEIHPSFLQSLHEKIDAAIMASTLRMIADTPAPSQCSSRTRGVVLERLARHLGILERGADYVSDAFASGSDVLLSGEGGVRLVAHMDEISYLIGGAQTDGRWPLRPYCYHLADGPRAAAVVRYEATTGYQVTSTGEVITDPDRRIWYRTDDPSVPEPGDRIFLPSPLDIEPETGRVTGSLDNAVGVAAVLLATQVLAHLEVPFSAVFPDEEEGPSGQASQTISRGAARVLPRLPEARVTVVTDIHGLAPAQQRETDDHGLPWGASLSECSSGTRGSVTPPPLYLTLRALFRDLEAEGIQVKPNIGGYVPRSDDVVAMLYTKDVCLLGFPGINRHFDHGLPTGNLHDFVDLSRALALLGVATAAGLIETR